LWLSSKIRKTKLIVPTGNGKDLGICDSG